MKADWRLGEAFDPGGPPAWMPPQLPCRGAEHTFSDTVSAPATKRFCVLLVCGIRCWRLSAGVTQPPEPFTGENCGPSQAVFQRPTASGEEAEGRRSQEKP